MRHGRAAVSLALLVTVVALGTLVARRPATAGLVIRTVALGQLNLLSQTIVDQQAGRAVILTSPQGPDPHCRVLVLDTHTGALLSSVDVGTAAFTVVLDKRNGRIFVSAGNTGPGRVYMLDEKSGAVLRTVRVGWFPSAMALDEHTGRLFVANANISHPAGGPGTVSVLDVRSGQILRSVTVGQRPEAVVVDQLIGRVFIMNAGSASVTVLDAASGRVLQTAPVGLDPTMLAIDQRTERAFAFGRHDVRVFDITRWWVMRTVALTLGGSPIGIADERAGRVLVANSGSKVVPVLDARTGALLYTLHVSGGPAWPTLDERSGRTYLIMGNNGTSNRLSVLETTTGRVLYTIPTPPYAGVVVDSQAGRFFVVTTNTVGTYDTRHGRLVHALTFGPKPLPPWPDEMIAPLFLVLAPRAGRAIVMDDITARVSVLDVHSGTILHTIHVGPQPVAALVDERAGHALVISLGGGTEQAPDPWAWVPSWLRERLPVLPQRAPGPRTVPASVTMIDVTR
jgi:YVTN family beta-propeller protein